MEENETAAPAAESTHFATGAIYGFGGSRLKLLCVRGHLWTLPAWRRRERPVFAIKEDGVHSLANGSVWLPGEFWDTGERIVVEAPEVRASVKIAEGNAGG